MSAPLTPENWPNVAPLLDALLDASPDGRAALLDELSGGDRSRRDELERLLAECERGDPLLDRPASERFAEIFREEQARFPDALADRYRLTHELGRGGMAAVFLARDLRHDRDVAVKVMRPELALGRERFLREIRIAAKLRHPHIVPLFDSGDANGVLYYVMPYEEGQSLRDRLRSGGVTIPVAEVVDILRDVCDALAHAHAQGIVHRDIKPDNVLLSGRTAMVTDFGVARAITEATVGAATSTGGVAIGTPAYMAPEQAAADPSIDHRADIYAVGVMAYELLSGRPPFIGDTPQVVLAHITETPMPVSDLRPDVPASLAAVVMKCLEKRAVNRWQQASELREALDVATRPGIDVGRLIPSDTFRDTAPSLAEQPQAVVSPARSTAAPWRRWSVAGAVVVVGLVGALGIWQRQWLRPAAGEPSRPLLAIGILPVVEATPRGELAYLVRGVPPQLSSELTQFEGLDLRPLETIDAAIALKQSLAQIALAHEVDYFLRATLSRSPGDSVEANLELIEGGLRSVRAGRVRASSLAPDAVQLLGRAVAEHLRPMLGSRVRERQLMAGTANPIALQHRRRSDQYRLTAMQRIGQRDVPGAMRALDSAEALLIESQRLDPKWTAAPLARAALASFKVIPFSQPGARDSLAIRRIFDAAVALVDSVLKRNPRDAVVLARRGRVRWQSIIGGGRLLTAGAAADSAARDLQTAFGLDTTLARAAADLSEVLFEAHGRFDEAAQYAERAYRLDAFLEDASAIINRLALSNLELANDLEALNWCREGIRRFPENPAHYACFLEVMAWGDAPANVDSAWKYFYELDRRVGEWDVTAKTEYPALVAGILARAPAVPRDSARAVLNRARAALATDRRVTAALRDNMLTVEAGVRYRLGDSAGGDQTFSLLQERDSLRARRWAQRRILRSFVSQNEAGRQPRGP